MPGGFQGKRATEKGRAAAHRGQGCTDATCSEAFRTIGTMNAHVKNTHGPQTILCTDATCSKAFGTIGKRNKHFAEVHAPKTILCTDATCSKAFGTIGTMNAHFKKKHVPKRKFNEAFTPVG
jgi:hypothetical protein